MKRFFNRPDTFWKHLSNCLHFYIEPDANAPIISAFETMGEHFSRIDSLSIQPINNIHLTVQRLTAYENELHNKTWQNALFNLRKKLQNMTPFTVYLNSPRASTHAIEAIGLVSDEWSTLISTVRECIIDSGLEAVLAAPPFAPHMTLCYCIRDMDDSEVNHILHRVGIPCEVTVNKITLVSVDQDRDEGVFRYNPLHEFTLTGN